MIELKTNPDHLHAIASNVRLTDQTDLAHDLDAAAHDMKNLRDYAEQIERSVNQMSGEIQSIRTQRDEAAAALLAIFRPELERMIDAAVEQCRPIDDLRERVERLEDDDDKADDIRRELRDMVLEGEIVVSLDLA
jgi:DNA repair exonuclease SbcCD ATPase subunit